MFSILSKRIKAKSSRNLHLQTEKNSFDDWPKTVQRVLLILEWTEKNAINRVDFNERCDDDTLTLISWRFVFFDFTGEKWIKHFFSFFVVFSPFWCQLVWLMRLMPLCSTSRKSAVCRYLSPEKAHHVGCNYWECVGTSVGCVLFDSPRRWRWWWPLSICTNMSRFVFCSTQSLDWWQLINFVELHRSEPTRNAF